MIRLAVKARTGNKKSELKNIRRENGIPAVLYSPDGECKNITISAVEYEAATRSILQGRLATTKFELDLGDKKIPALVKDVQYDLTNYKVIHIDFMQLEPKRPVKLKVPIDCLGVAESAGVKLGGFFNQVLRFVTARCLPGEIPACLEIDVRNMGIGQSKRLAEIELPKGLKLLVKPEEVVAVIAKR